jgi:hypothetical protein
MNEVMGSALRSGQRLWSTGETECLLFERDEAPRFEICVKRGDDVLKHDRLYAKASAEMLAEAWQNTLNRQSNDPHR